MKPEERQIAIYHMIKANKEMSIEALSERFGVSTMTIRRDLDKLEHSQLIYRVYGKVHIMDGTKVESSFSHRETINLERKQKIARTASKYLDQIQSIYVDGSSTAYEFVKQLPDLPLTIFTNSVAMIQLLRSKKGIRTFVIGGFLSKNLNSLDDATSVDISKQIYIDATFTSCAGFSVEGSFNNGITGSAIRRVMQKNSSCNYLLADHTKFNAQGIFLLNSWDVIDVLITDEPFDKPAMDVIRSHNVKIVW